MNKIFQDQNSNKNLNRLAAQRQIYSDAKNLQLWQLLLTVISIVLLSFLVLYWANLQVYLAAYSLILLISDIFVITPYIDRLRTKGAKVQELFDCELFGIEWSNICAGDTPDYDDIIDNANRYIKKQKNFDVLKNWYPKNVKGLPLIGVILACQKINSWWDSKLRSKYGVSILICLAIIFAIVFILALVGGITVNSFILTVLFPLAPIFTIGFKQYLDNKKTTDIHRDLIKHINQSLTKIQKTNKKKIRDIQNEIFNARKSSPLLFDFFYWFYKNSFESKAHQIVQNIKKK